MNNLKNHKYLLIGFGRMGERYFNLLKKSRIKDIIVIEKNKDRIKLLTLKYKVDPKNIFSSLKNDFFKKNKTKFICIIATTADFRLNLIRILSTLNIKYIFCEKPMARSINEAEKIIKLCKIKKIHLSINHSRRYAKETMVIRKIAKKNSMGNLICISLNGANIGIAMVAIHLIEIFLHETKSKITNIYGKLIKNKLSNPRGRKFKDYNGYIFCKNKKNQNLIINTSESAGHGCCIFYTYQKGMIMQDWISGKIFVTARRTKYLNEPNYKYNLPQKNTDINFKNSKLPDITKIALKKFLMNKDFVKPENSLEALKVVIGSIQSSKLNKEINIKNLNKDLKYEFA